MKIEDVTRQTIRKSLLKKWENRIIEIEEELDNIADMSDEEIKKIEYSIKDRISELKKEKEELENKIDEVINDLKL